MFEQNSRRIIKDVSVLPLTGETRYIYRLTTDGAFYVWNGITSAFDKITNDAQAGYTSKVQHEVKLEEDITIGQAVYVSGADGTNMLVSKASNTTEALSSKTLGLLLTSGVTNNKRQVITEGLFPGLNTSTATIGDPVWLGTNGDLIYGLANKPVAPAHLVYIGVVTRVNSSNGEIFVKVQNGYELEELHNVLISSLADGDVLKYDSTSGLWKNTKETQADFAQTDALEPDFIKNKPTVTDGVGTPIGTATIGSIYIEKDSLGNEVGSYTYDGTNWVSLAFNQVQADWTEVDTSDPSYIQNKPTLANVAISGDYSSLLNKPTIPDPQIQSDYTQTDNNQLDFIKNKPDLSVYELVANKGVPNGYVPLNGSGLIDSSFLSISGTEYKGVWNPTTNTPTLVDGTGTNGWFYYVSEDGIIDLGSGYIDFKEGNIVIYDTISSQWKKVGGQQLITNDLDISVTDFTSTSVYYYGGNSDAGDWQVNKWVVATNVKSIANVTNNTTYTSLPTAWVDRLTLNYI
jgi:hypothetical protein